MVNKKVLGKLYPGGLDRVNGEGNHLGITSEN